MGHKLGLSFTLIKEVLCRHNKTGFQPVSIPIDYTYGTISFGFQNTEEQKPSLIGKEQTTEHYLSVCLSVVYLTVYL